MRSKEPHFILHMAMRRNNKKFAVMGTGASRDQLVQEIGAEVSELIVFQRIPNTA